MSKLKQSADNHFKFDENSRKFSKRVENTVGQGEIALYEQFLLFPQCFQKACFPGASKGVIVWKWINSITTKKINCAFSLAKKTLPLKKQFSYNLVCKCGQCRSEIRLHVL